MFVQSLKSEEVLAQEEMRANLNKDKQFKFFF